MKDFTITHIGDTALSLPMPFKFIPAKGKTYIFNPLPSPRYLDSDYNKSIIFTKDFWLCAYACTQEFWAVVIKASDLNDLDPNPSNFKGKNRPVEQVSWDDIQVFNKALNALLNNQGLIIEGKTQLVGQFGLPSETQWEFAAKSEQETAFIGSDHVVDVAWYNKNSNYQTMPVGLKQPNVWGLFDLSGNVWEWCADDYLTNDYITKFPDNPIIDHKVLKGGDFFANIKNCFWFSRSSYNHQNKSSSRGFRLAFLSSF